MESSPLHQQAKSLPDLTRIMLAELNQRISDLFPAAISRKIQHIFITGCGDSHHAALNAELAFMQLAGISCEAHTAMKFSRYIVPFLPRFKNGENLVLGISGLAAR